MMIIKVEECTTLFNELKAGDIFAFTTSPARPYIKTIKSHSIDYACEECNEEGSIDMRDFCIELETGAFYEANSWDKVILYRRAELVLSR